MPGSGDPLAAGYSVTVVDGDPRLRTRLAMVLSESSRAAAFPSLAAAAPRLAEGGPVVVVAGPSLATPAGMAELSRLARTTPGLATVMVVAELSVDTLQRAIRSGLGDVVAEPVEPAELLDAVERAAANLRVPAPVPSLAAPAGAGARAGHGRVVTVFSAKGGAGRSFVATNLAVALAEVPGARVVLVDADLRFGDVAVMLGLTPEHSIVDAVRAIDGLDAEGLGRLLVRHPASGVEVLAAPPEPAFADSVTAGHLRTLVDLLASRATHVVIDTPASFDEVVLGVLERSDDIVLLAGMEVPSIKNTRIGLQTLRLLHVPAGKIKLVLNRANSKVRLDVADVERALQLKADCLIPSDIVVPQSLNSGVPVVLDAPRSTVGRSLRRLAALVGG